MLAWFRRQRFLAAILIAANPALVGSWLAAYHPCPVKDGALGRWGAGAVEAPAPAMSEHSGHEGMMMAEEAPAPSGQAPAHDHGTGDGPCSCIGQCLTAGIALPSVADDETRLAVTITQHSARSTQHPTALPGEAPPYLLPPSTAPPSV